MLNDAGCCGALHAWRRGFCMILVRRCPFEMDLFYVTWEGGPLAPTVILQFQSPFHIIIIIIHHQFPMHSDVSIVFCASFCLSPLFQSLQNLIASLFSQQSKTRRWCWRNTLRKRWCWGVIWWSQIPIPHSRVMLTVVKFYRCTLTQYTLSWYIPDDAYGNAKQISTRCAHVPTLVLIYLFLPLSIVRCNAHDGMHTMACSHWNANNGMQMMEGRWRNPHDGICTIILTMESVQ